MLARYDEKCRLPPTTTNLRASLRVRAVRDPQLTVGRVLRQLWSLEDRHRGVRSTRT